MQSTLKEHLISAGITFVSTFFLVVSVEIANPQFVFSKEALVALTLSAIVAGVRSVAKIIYELCSELLTSKQ